MKTRKFLLPAATAGILALTLSACGGGGGGTTGGGGTDAEANLDGRGPITYVQGKDNNNVVRPSLKSGMPPTLTRRSPSRSRRTRLTSSTMTWSSTSRPSSRTMTSSALTLSGRPSLLPRAGCSRSRTRWPSTPQGMLEAPVESGLLQGHALRGPQGFRWRHPLLPQGPCPHAAQDVGRNCFATHTFIFRPGLGRSGDEVLAVVEDAAIGIRCRVEGALVGAASMVGFSMPLVSTAILSFSGCSQPLAANSAVHTTSTLATS